MHVAALKLAPWERRRKMRWATGIICVGLWYFVVDIDLWLLPSLSDVEGMGASLKYKPTIYHCPQKGGGACQGGRTVVEATTMIVLVPNCLLG